MVMYSARAIPGLNGGVKDGPWHARWARAAKRPLPLQLRGRHHMRLIKASRSRRGSCGPSLRLAEVLLGKNKQLKLDLLLF